MALTDSSPREGGAYLSWLLGLGLALILAGERLLGDTAAWRLSLTGGGAAACLIAILWRAAVLSRAREERRGVQRLLLGGYLGAAAALLVYAAGAPEVIDKLGLSFPDAAARGRWRDAVTAVWPIVMMCSLVAVLFVEVAWAPMREAHLIEARRVRSAGAAGLTVALAAAFLVLAGFIASERDHKLDMSYFRTSRPSESTVRIAKSFPRPVRALVFFPDVNEVRDEVRGYLAALARESGNLTVEVHDRLLSPELAEEYRVTRDGMIVLARTEEEKDEDERQEDKSEKYAIGAELEEARPKLRKLDAEVQKMLLKIARRRRTAYLTSGHGELNDPPRGPVERAIERGGSDAFEKLLDTLNMTVKPLSLAEGLAQEVPGDATLVAVLGPTAALLPEEQAALARYLRRGGRLLAALDPDGEADLGEIGEALGLKLVRERLANDRVYVRRWFNDSDRGVLATNRFSSHASVTTLSQHSRELAAFFPGAGSIERGDDAKAGKDNRVDFTIRSMFGTFNDKNGNFAFEQDAGEKRSTFNLAAAVSRKLTPEESKAAADARDKPMPGEEEEPLPDELRAVVVSDGEAMSDPVLGNLGNLYFAADAVKWLAGEEKFAGEVATSEEDVKIQHTRKEDQVWFYATIFGVPAIVLGGGLTYTWRLRRRRR